MKAKEILRGLVPKTHHDGAKKVLQAKENQAMETYLSVKALLQETKRSLEEERRRVDDFEKVEIKLTDRVNKVIEALQVEQIKVDGKPRLYEEGLLGLEKERTVIAAQITQQTKLIISLKGGIMQLENDLLRAEFHIRHCIPEKGEDLQEIAQQLEEERVIARMRVSEESKAAQKLEEVEQERLRRTSERIKGVEEKVAKQIIVAKDSNRVALRRILETSTERRKWTQIMVEAEEDKHNNRVEAILQLKAKIDQNMMVIKGQNEKINNKKKERLDKLERTKAQLLAAGHNPYVVFKQEELDREAALQEKALQARVQERQEILATKIVKDMEYERAEAERLAIEKEYEQKQRNELGRHVTEARNREYLIEKTTKKVDIVDPTGRSLRIDPSQVTTIVDRSFGLGFNPRKDKEQIRQVLDKIISSDKDYEDVGLGQYTLLLPKRLKDVNDPASRSSSANSSWLETFLAPEMDAPGHDLIEEDEANAEPVDADEGVPLETNRLLQVSCPRSLSMFEQDCLEKAQRLRRERLEQGVRQVVCNKAFVGASFVSEPAVIEFKDYTLGTTHRRKIVLTNVSHAVNRFKVLDLPNEIRDFFEIIYEKPGGMSPGMSCRLNILFSPKIARVFTSSLPLLTETGPISIPIVCTYPKVKPSLLTPGLHFEHVVMGEKSTLYIKVKNEGALPTKYRIIDLASVLAHQGQCSDLLPAVGGGIKEEEEGAVRGELGVSFPEICSPESAAGAAGAAAAAGENEDDNGSSEQSLMERVAQKQVEWLEKAKQKGDIFRFKDHGEIGPYSEVLRAVTFVPLEPGVFHLERIISFRCGDGQEEQHFTLTLQGQAIDVPIYIEHNIIDMRCCVLDKLYRADVMVKNRSKIAYKITTSIPKELKNIVELSPDLGFVQPKIGFKLQVKFRPNKDLVEACGQYAIQKEDGSHLIAVPVQVNIPEQVVPLYFVLKAQLTAGSLSFSTRCLDFGNVNTTEAYNTRFKLKNDSHLAQKIGFIKTPNYVDIYPNDGFIVLLPLEETELEVVLKPRSAIQHNFHLTIRTSLNMTYKIQVLAQGVHPALSFSSSLLKLAASCPEDVISRDLYLKNATKLPQTFEFVLPQPALSHLKIAPMIGCIQPSKSQRITVWFCPPEQEDEGGKAMADIVPPSGAGKMEEAHPVVPEEEGSIEYIPHTAIRGGESEQQQQALSPSDPELNEQCEEELWSRHAKWKVACFIKDATVTKSALGPGQHPFIFLEAHTCVIPRELSIDQSTIQFGQVPVGQVKTVTVRIRNSGPEEASLKIIRGPNAVGCYRIINALRPIPPANIGFKTILLQFAPTLDGVRTEVILFKSPSHGKELFLKVQGEGVKASLELEPSNGRLDFGHVLEGKAVVRSFSLKNTSPFPVQFELRAVGAEVPENHNHILPFQCSPSEAEIKEGETCSIKVTFAPDHEVTSPITQTYEVCVTGQAEKKYITLQGRAWRRQLYATTLEEDGLPHHLAAQQHEDSSFMFPPQLQQIEKETLQSLGIGQKPRHNITLKFPKVEDSSPLQRRTIVIGSASLCGAAAAAAAAAGGTVGGGSFEIEVGEEAKKAAIITVTPEKGTVGPDTKMEVVFTYKPDNRNNVAGALVVGQWMKFSAKVHLKGGYKPANDPDLLTVPISLECFVYI